MLKSETKTFKIPVSEILYLEAKGNYTNIVTETEEHKIYSPLYKIEEELSPKYFLRIHRSYIVSINKIRLANSHTVKLGRHELPVGRNYKDNVKQWMK